jgi:hypothetical protein
MKSITNNHGSALMITLALMAMLAFVAIMALDRSTTDVDLSYNQLHGDQAFYTAEAGIERAIFIKENDRSWVSGFVDEPLGRGFYSVTVTDASDMPALLDTIIFRANGRIDRAEANVEAWVVPEKLHPFDYALFGDTIVTMSNSSCTDSYNSDSGSYGATLDHDLATVGSNDSLILENIASVGGDAISAIEGGIVIDNKALVRGDTVTGVDPRDIDIVDESEYLWAEEVSIASTGISGTDGYDPTDHSLTVGALENAVLSSGVYFFSDITLEQNGSIELEPGAEVIIYMTGDLMLRNSSEFNSLGTPPQLIIYSTGSLLSLGNNTVLTAAFYGPDAEFILDNYTDFFGSVVAETIDFRNNVCFHYDRSLSQIEKGETGKLIVVAWREL